LLCTLGRNRFVGKHRAPEAVGPHEQHIGGHKGLGLQASHRGDLQGQDHDGRRSQSVLFQVMALLYNSARDKLGHIRKKCRRDDPRANAADKDPPA